ncbi:MAG: amidohydrolase family protein [Candidatus Lokiarchaeota archaeon]|nr:amidohydrolase family protein [Candidatus Lokiarchaeota archaeon]
MHKTTIHSPYGLIGETLELKKNVSVDIDDKGNIIDISHEDLEDNILHLEAKQPTLMIPGLINSHVHIGDSFAKELGFNRGLSEIVAPPFGLKHKLLRQTSEEIIIIGIKKAISEMLSNGITCFVDFREGGVEGVNLLRKTLEQEPINCLIYGRFMDESEIEAIFELADGVGLASYDQISMNNKKYVTKSKLSLKKMIACHCAENNHDPNLLDNIFNDNIVDVIIHGTKLNKKDLIRIQKEEKSLVLCPRCNGYFGVGFPPITEILQLKIPISLGTDNIMANNTDLFEEMRYLYRILRVLGSYDKSIQLTSKELLRMVTINAARNFKLEGKMGSISKGKAADFFLIDLNEPNLYTYNLNKNNIFDIIVQRIRSDNIKRTYIKGELVFERN